MKFINVLLIGGAVAAGAYLISRSLDGTTPPDGLPYDPSIQGQQDLYNEATKPRAVREIEEGIPYDQEVQTYTHEGKLVRSSSPEVVEWAGGSSPQIIPVKGSSDATIREATDQFVDSSRHTEKTYELAKAIQRKFAR